MQANKLISSTIESIHPEEDGNRALEMMDQLCIEAAEEAVGAGYPKGAGAVLLVEIDGLEESVEEESDEIESIS